MIKPYYSWDYKINENGEFDIPVGETFDYKGKTLKVVWDNGSYCCNDCFFAPRKEKGSCFGFACFADERLDGQDVIFEEVKAGEPEIGATGITEKDGKKYRWTKVAAGYIVKEVEVPPEEEKRTPPLPQAITEAAALAVAGILKKGEKE